MATAATAIVALWFSAQSLRSTEQQYSLSEQGQVTDRFTKAVEQLGSDKPDVRLGSIYSLERLGRDSPEDQPVILEILTAFLRAHGVACGQPPAPASFPEDTQAALTVIGCRDATHDGPRLLQLSDVCLAGASLFDGDFASIGLFDVDLTGANLNFVHLAGALMMDVRLGNAVINFAELAGVSLQHAEVTGARMREVDLTGALLHHSNFTGADLFAARLTDARLIGTNLTGADLTYADLTYADLTGADLTGADLTGVCYDSRTTWPEGFTPPQPPTCPRATR